MLGFIFSDLKWIENHKNRLIRKIVIVKTSYSYSKIMRFKICMKQKYVRTYWKKEVGSHERSILEFLSLFTKGRL